MHIVGDGTYGIEKEACDIRGPEGNGEDRGEDVGIDVHTIAGGHTAGQRWNEFVTGVESLFGMIIGKPLCSMVDEPTQFLPVTTGVLSDRLDHRLKPLRSAHIIIVNHRPKPLRHGLGWRAELILNTERLHVTERNHKALLRGV